MHPPLKKMWGITYAIYPSSSRPIPQAHGAELATIQQDVTRCTPFPFLSAKNTKFVVGCRHMGSFKLRMHQNPFSAGAPPQTPLGELTTLPRPIVGWGGGHHLPIPLPLDAFGVSISPPSPFLLKEIYANGNKGAGYCHEVINLKTFIDYLTFVIIRFNTPSRQQ